MRNKLKQFRVAAGLTQAKLAKSVGVTQPNYQRWESGSAPIPEEKLRRLAKVLKISPETILGRHAPIEALEYYGEVAIHFCGGGAPLLLSISEEEFARLHRDLQGSDAFVSVESLANQTVAIRMKAIFDVYFSSEAYDDYGPDHRTYANHVELLIPDARDWEIVEALAVHSNGIQDFDQADVERIKRKIMITDEQYGELVAKGLIDPENLESERAKNQARTDLIFDLATKTTYQFSTGQQRSVEVWEPVELFNAFYELIDFNGGEPADDMIRLEAEGSHRIIFINKTALDYVMMPTHRYHAGRTDADADALEAFEKSERAS
jgi:transcriptional regulator with XRE-family HTH domain